MKAIKHQPEEAELQPARLSTVSATPPGGGLAPIERETLYDKVYAQLSQALRQGQFEMGQPLSLRGLAAMLGVSMMPVRDVVGRLVNEGVLETLPNRQVRVPFMTIRQYEALIEARVAAEGYAAYLAAIRLDDAALSEVQAANERLEKAAQQHDHVAIMQANQEFHFSIYRAAHSETLLQIIENLWQQSGPYLATIENAMAANPTMRDHDFGAGQHDRICAALARRDGEAARQALVEDIEGFAKIYKQLLVPPSTEKTTPGPRPRVSKVTTHSE
ncbi:GntR family transcriptional regulator [Cupriavidus sp. IK-TO18]|uniref:GntR family transcriptional regulator n=1 Tax=Cupriavidus sp. IK-TO18 TaxID=2782182 RepID=UPI001896F5C8|nr:GntR family transcriptional regulator [Cupriavidus sp. IK-TO18]MBF6992520.1 GntR family transcriptional regulator [Cupriavidus sp. IK-TO18]